DGEGRSSRESEPSRPLAKVRRESNKRLDTDDGENSDGNCEQQPLIFPPALNQERDRSCGAPQHHSCHQVELRPGSLSEPVDGTKSGKGQDRRVTDHETSRPKCEVNKPLIADQLCLRRELEMDPPESSELAVGGEVRD